MTNAQKNPRADLQAHLEKIYKEALSKNIKEAIKRKKNANIRNKHNTHKA